MPSATKTTLLALAARVIAAVTVSLGAAMVPAFASEPVLATNTPAPSEGTRSPPMQSLSRPSLGISRPLGVQLQSASLPLVQPAGQQPSPPAHRVMGS